MKGNHLNYDEWKEVNEEAIMGMSRWKRMRAYNKGYAKSTKATDKHFMKKRPFWFCLSTFMVFMPIIFLVAMLCFLGAMEVGWLYAPGLANYTNTEYWYGQLALSVVSMGLGMGLYLHMWSTLYHNYDRKWREKNLW